MNAFSFGRFVKQAVGPTPPAAPKPAGGGMMQGLKSMGQAANNWSAKNLGLAMPNKSELGQAYGNAANNAIASRPGQAVLGGAAQVYNNYAPQAVKGFVGRQMPTYHHDPREQQIYQEAGVKSQPAPFQTHEQDVGAYIDSHTEVQNDQLTRDRIDSYTPATNFGTPLQQIGYGLSGGRLPSQTFKPGDEASYHVGVENDKLTNQELVPGRYDQQPGTAATTQQKSPQSFGQWLGSKLGM